MIADLLRNVLRFIILVLLQVLVVKNIPFNSYFIPFPYLLFILLLPFETLPIIVLAAAFILGLTIDVFYDLQGVHTTACVIIGFLRTYILKLIAPREGYETSMKPTLQYMGFIWFLSYAGILILIHHLFFFTLQVFGFNHFGITLLRVLASAATTFLFIYIIQFLFYRNDSIS